MNLSFPKSVNTAGLKNIFWFVAISNVLSQDGATVILKPGEKWNTGKATRFKPDFKEKQKDGKLLSIAYKAFVPKRTPELDQVLNAMLPHEGYLLIYDDFNGYRRIAGTVETPLTFKFDLPSGKKPGDTNGVNIQFDGISTEHLALLYVDDIDADDPVPGPEVPTGPPVIVEWNAGNVVAVAQPGETVTIVSDFSADEIIIT